MLDSTSMPRLYSFVSTRRERFGGFLFNPYLQVELPLDDFELAVVNLCDGQHAVAIMPVELARTFRTDRATAERRLAHSLDRLNGYFALNWKGASPRALPTAHGSDVECSRDHLPPSPGAEGCLSAPLSILWEVTHACNLNCLHCLSASGRPAPGELSTAEAKALIEELARLHVFSVTVGGGEPLVRGDLFELLELITQKNLAARLSTNGYAVTDDTLKKLADLNVFAVQVSIDGLRETHDRFRGRSGAFDRAIQALRLFREAGYHTFMTATATALNIDEMPALVDLALDLGVSTLKMGPYVPMGRAAENQSLLSLSPQQLQDLALTMQARKEETKGSIDLQIDGLFPWLLEREPDRSPCAEEVGPGCSAGTSSVTVSYDGSVYPCVYIRDASAGNVRHELLGDIWRNQTVFGPLRTLDRKQIKGACQACAYRPTVCRGGCRGAAFAATGDLYGHDPNCWLSARTSGDAS